MQIQLKLLGLLLVVMIVQVSTVGRAPKPYCTSKPTIKQFPLAIGQKLEHDMSDLFSGYNLQITQASNNSFAAITKKWYDLDQAYSYYPNIISHFIEKQDNTVGRDAFLLFKNNVGATILTYGIIDKKDRLPSVNSTAIVQTDENVTCFDAALFLDHGLAVVDCAKKGGKLFSTYTNYWYIINLASQTHEVRKIENDLYIGYSSITRRSLMKFSHPEAGGFTYLLRSYYSDGVDQAHSDNTYMEIFIVPVEDPTDIQPLRVIDRTFLNLNSLRIMDAQIYLDDIFLLDYDTGLYRLDILQSQRVAITGTYRDYGFVRFGVYSDDLQNEVIIALANKHSVYEIDWRKITKPQLINKYSLMQNSRIKQIQLNDRYLLVQSVSDAQNDTNPNFEIDYTWVFTKGSRTYLNAYHVINHNSSIVEIQFDRDNNRLYIADQSGLLLIELHPALLRMDYLDKAFVGKEENIVIFATSSDPNTKQTMICQQVIKAILVSRQNMTLFPTGMSTTSVYSVNYPKSVTIPLQNYVHGPNVNYQIKFDKQQTDIPTYWINKVNKTKVHMDQAPAPGDVKFFHTDVVPQLGQEIVIYYYQDAVNNTHVAICMHHWLADSMNCTLQRTYNHTSRIRTFASSYFEDEQGFQYFYSIVFDGQPNLVHIYDFQTQKQVAQITYIGGYQSQIESIASSNDFLYVVRKFVKTIDVYSLAKCAQYSTCRPDFSITSETMKGFKINYFTPLQVVTDYMHPEVMFIKCLGALIILDVDNKQKLTLLDEIIYDPTLVSNYNVAVSEKRMIISAYPDLVYEYSLEHLYTYNMVTLTKVLSTYGHKIQPNADIEFSDIDSTVYINAYDPNKNVSVILVYRTGHAASNTFYTKIQLDKLYSRPGFEVQVSGFYVNFLSIVTSDKFSVYRVFTYPWLEVKQNHDDFNFQIEAYNEASSYVSSAINVSVVNTNQDITPSQEFNQADLTVRQSGRIQFSDRHWFDGNVLHYNYTCDQCHKGNESKVIIREHFDNFADLHLNSYHYTETLMGGVSVWQDLFRYRPNGSIYQVNNLPDQDKMEYCLRVAVSELQIFALTACQQIGRGVNLYVTSFSSFKGFTWGPYRSDAVQVRNLQVINDIAMLVDTSANPEFKFQKGAVYLYKLSFNSESGDQMDELQVIDSNDFMGCAGWNEDQAYLGNAHMLYSGVTNAYRLYVTQINHGLFVMDFVKAHIQDAEITVLTTSYIDLNKLLADNNLHMPNDAIFLGVTFVKSIVLPQFDSENILVTTRGYHNFQITLVYDSKGYVQAPILHRVYHRYIFFNAVNEVQARSGFILIGYVLPPGMDSSYYANQYITLYDSIDYPHQFDKGYSERYMIAGIPLNTTTAATYAINTTYDFRTNGTRSGVVIGIPSLTSPKLYEASISHNLTLELLPDFANQTLKAKAYNDFKAYEFSAELINYTPSPPPPPPPPPPGDDNTLIIIVIVLCSIVVVFFVFYIISVLKKKKTNQTRDSLLTQNQSLARSSIQQPLIASQQIAEEQEQRTEESISPLTQVVPSQTQKQLVREVDHEQNAVPAPAVEPVLSQPPKQDVVVVEKEIQIKVPSDALNEVIVENAVQIKVENKEEG